MRQLVHPLLAGLCAVDLLARRPDAASSVQELDPGLHADDIAYLSSRAGEVANTTSVLLEP